MSANMNSWLLSGGRAPVGNSATDRQSGPQRHPSFIETSLGAAVRDGDWEVAGAGEDAQRMSSRSGGESVSPPTHTTGGCIHARRTRVSPSRVGDPIGSGATLAPSPLRRSPAPTPHMRFGTDALLFCTREAAFTVEAAGQRKLPPIVVVFASSLPVNA